MSRRIVLDASAALEAVLLRPRADAVLAELERASVVLVPGLYHAEVANDLWKYIRAGTLETQDAVERFERAAALPDRTIPDADLAEEALACSSSSDHPAYDMLYAVLARRFGCTVCSFDRRLGSALETMNVDGLILRR